MNALRSYAWAFALVGAALTTGFLVRMYLLGGVDLRGQLLAVAAALCLVTYYWLDRPTVEAVARDRSVQLASGATTLVVLAGAAAVAAYAVVRSVDVYVDLTQDTRVSLSEHSVKVAKSIDQDVTLYGFFRHGSGEQASFVRLAKQYEMHNPRLSLQLVDPLREPSLARKFDVSSDASVVLVAGDRAAPLGRRFDELAVTQALRRVVSGEDMEICWSVGHGEAAVDADDDENAASAMVLALDGQSYFVREASVLAGPIPASCAAFVIMAPRTAWEPAETDLLQDYLLGGGRVMALLEPGFAGSPAVAAALRPFGIAVGEHPIIEPDPTRRFMGIDDPSVFVERKDSWVPHRLSQSLAGAVLMHISTSAEAIDDTPGVAARSLLWSSDRAWLEKDGPGEVEPGPHESVGRRSLVAISEVRSAAEIDLPERGAREDGGRLFVVGDSAFATNSYPLFGSNKELFLNAISWLVDEEELIGERPKTSDEVLEISVAEELLLTLLAVFVMPGIALLLALRSHWRRRSL